MRRALVVGSAANFWADVDAAEKLAYYDTIYCINMTGVCWNRRPFTWVSLHPEHMQGFCAQRLARGLPASYDIVGPLAEECGNHQQPMQRRVSYLWQPGASRNSGSSGLFAVKIALEENHDRIVLAGVPMVKEAGHFHRGVEWQQCNLFVEGWKLVLPRLLGKVKSMSGWTQELLGTPTKQWLETDIGD